MDRNRDFPYQLSTFYSRLLYWFLAYWPLAKNQCPSVLPENLRVFDEILTRKLCRQYVSACVIRAKFFYFFQREQVKSCALSINMGHWTSTFTTGFFWSSPLPACPNNGQKGIFACFCFGMSDNPLFYGNRHNF